MIERASVVFPEPISPDKYIISPISIRLDMFLPNWFVAFCDGRSKIISDIFYNNIYK